MSIKHRLEASAMLLKHYRTTFRTYWDLRHQVGSDLFRREEAEFLPAALEIQEKPVSPTLRMTAKVIITILAIGLGWTFFATLDIFIAASGEIIPHERTKTVASIDTATVKALHVTEGQMVKKGDLLIELDTTAVDAEHDKAQSNVTEARLKIARSQALISAIDHRKPPRLAALPDIPSHRIVEVQEHLNGQFRDFMARVQRLEGSITRYTESLELISRRVADYKELARSHDVSMHTYLEKEQERSDIEGQLKDAKNQLTGLIADAKRIAYDEQEEAAKSIGEARQDVTRNAAHSKLLRLVAPVTGTVQQLEVYTIGGVVQGAQPLMKIVPKEDHIEVVAKIENRDVGFVEVGQLAAVKVDAFDYAKFGFIQGKVINISQDAVKDEKRGLLYSLTIALDRSSIMVKGHEVPLTAGMTVTADIKTGSRRVIEYFLSPFIQHKQESLHER